MIDMAKERDFVETPVMEQQAGGAPKRESARARSGLKRRHMRELFSRAGAEKLRRRGVLKSAIGRAKKCARIGRCDVTCAGFFRCCAQPHRGPKISFPDTPAAAFAARLCDSTRNVQKSGRKRVVPVAH